MGLEGSERLDVALQIYVKIFNVDVDILGVGVSGCKCACVPVALRACVGVGRGLRLTDWLVGECRRYLLIKPQNDKTS